jgi:uncharacterized membrane protein SpoIIM required for sporulation
VSARDAFVARRRSRWNELEALLDRVPLHRLPPADISRTAALYRDACADLMQARALSLGTDVTTYLDTLVGRGHSALYGPRPYSVRAAADLLFRTFPATLRRNGLLFMAAALLFVVPLAVGCVMALRSEAFALGVLPRWTLEQFANDYAGGFSKGRAVGTAGMMAGYYVQNNVGIAFRCFATGIVYGVGSVFFLFYNGLLIGTTLGFVVRGGAGVNILTFMGGHSPFELTAIVISGTAGLRMGYALIATGGRSRRQSLRAAGSDLGALILGAAALLLVAACIEAFWSPSSVPNPVKWVVSAINWTAVVAFLWWAGREPRR